MSHHYCLFILFGGGGFLLLISACKEDTKMCESAPRGIVFFLAPFNKNRAIEIKSKIKERFLQINLHMSNFLCIFAASNKLGLL